tara:strand:- start:8477 stop:8896 length:420 start_codon:yes stop_codon:yes gene_type:complete
MFSLIISIIAIALAAVLLLTSAFYGGDALTQGTAKAQASAAVNEAQQISAAYELYKAENFGVRPGAIADVSGPDSYLKQPIAGWEFDGAVQPVVAEKQGLSEEVCEIVQANAAVNGVGCDPTSGTSGNLDYVATYNLDI